MTLRSHNVIFSIYVTCIAPNSVEVTQSGRVVARSGLFVVNLKVSEIREMGTISFRELWKLENSFPLRDIGNLSLRLEQGGH